MMTFKEYYQWQDQIDGATTMLHLKQIAHGLRVLPESQEKQDLARLIGNKLLVIASSPTVEN